MGQRKKTNGNQRTRRPTFTECHVGASPRVGRAGSPATNTSQYQFKMSIDIEKQPSPYLIQQRRDFQCSYLHKNGTLNSIFQSIESKHFTKLHNRLHDDVAVEKAYNTVPHGPVVEYYLRDNRYTTFYEWKYLFFPCAFNARIISITGHRAVIDGQFCYFQ